MELNNNRPKEEISLESILFLLFVSFFAGCTFRSKKIQVVLNHEFGLEMGCLSNSPYSQTQEKTMVNHFHKLMLIQEEILHPTIYKGTGVLPSTVCQDMSAMSSCINLHFPQQKIRYLFEKTQA